MAVTWQAVPGYTIRQDHQPEPCYNPLFLLIVPDSPRRCGEKAAYRVIDTRCFFRVEVFKKPCQDPDQRDLVCFFHRIEGAEYPHHRHRAVFIDGCQCTQGLLQECPPFVRLEGFLPVQGKPAVECPLVIGLLDPEGGGLLDPGDEVQYLRAAVPGNNRKEIFPADGIFLSIPVQRMRACRTGRRLNCPCTG